MADQQFVIPTIDISPYLADPASPAAAQVVAEVRQACMTTGFFSLVGHNVPRELQQRLLDGCKKLFALPLETKKALHPPGILKNRGYEMIGSQMLQDGTLPDLKEGYFVGQHIPYSDPRAQRHPYLMGENIFPAELADAELRVPAESYYQAVYQLGSTVMDILARGLSCGSDKDKGSAGHASAGALFSAFMANDPLCNMRLLHYPPQQISADARQLGVGAHTDFGAITLLYQDAAGGLEVLDQARQAWVPVAPQLDAFVVNVGDMLSLWTKNVYKSNVHRVINRSGTDRYSVPFFIDGNLDLSLAPLDGSEPPDGRAVTVGEHILNRIVSSHEAAQKHQEQSKGQPLAPAVAAA